MTITYTGQAALAAPQKKKFEEKLKKIAKLLDRGGEKSARVILTTERHLHHAEITVQYYDRPLVGIGSNSDPLQAGVLAIEKLEKQVLKVGEKRRDTSRRPVAKTKRAEPAMTDTPAEVPAKSAAKKSDAKKAAAAAKAAPAGGRVFKLNPKTLRKPMTVDEAMLELTDGKSHIAYRDADSDRVSVLVRRADGHFDLIEG
ncbi:MAG: HPF/RaiA family ribosome-associated protein [Bryobacterales bacterium]|nr:HPF/RaiA family ribosome-associated protein [Bryobacterales bacterium]